MDRHLKIAADLRALSETATRTASRQSYLPSELRGTKPNVNPEGTDLEIWTWEQDTARATNVPFAIAFQGRAQNPLWWNTFRSESERDRKVKDTIEYRKTLLEKKRLEREEKKKWNSGAKVGDILYTSWGYDQTNVEFYQITQVGKKQIAIREIGKKVLSDNGQSAKVIAAPNKFIGPVMKKIPQKAYGDRGYYVKIHQSANAYPWDGRPTYQTGAYGGH